MSLGLPFDATELTGIAAFAIAGTACARATRRSPTRLWGALAALHLVFALEVALGARYRLHDLVDAALGERGLYASREALQWWLIAGVAGLGVVAIAVLGIAARGAWRADARLGVAALASIVTLTVFGSETVSLHAIDALMYAQAGPVRAIAWMWVVPAFVVTLAAMWSPPRSRR